MTSSAPMATNKPEVAALPRVASFSDSIVMSAFTEVAQCHRMGVMAAFPSFDEFVRFAGGFVRALSLRSF